MALAHPFRYRDNINIDLEAFPIDAVEIASNNTPVEEKGKIRRLASKLGIPVLCNSDSHIQSTIGSHYNIVQGAPAEEMELIRLLKAGRFQCRIP